MQSFLTLVLLLQLLVPTTAQAWTTAGPGQRGAAQLLYLAARQECVMLGGKTLLGAPDPADFTWLWNGDRWAVRRTQQAPPTMTFQACVDTTRGRIVLLSGDLATPTTWEYDGVDWAQVPTSVAPIGRHDAGMAYDSGRQRVVLFGGQSQFGLLFDTWEYDGVTWQARGSLPAPPVRSLPALAYDPVRQRTVMHGGGAAFGVTLHDTWEWDGNAWTQRATPSWPPYANTMLWLPQRQRLALWDNTNRWEFDGTAWTAQPIGSRPFVTTLLAYDEQRQQLVQVGRGFRSWLWADEVWTYGTAWQPAYEGPPERVEIPVASDFVRNRVILLDGTKVRQRTSRGWSVLASGVPVLGGAQLAHDPEHAQCLLFGSVPNWPFGAMEMWQLQGTTWSSLATAHTPPVGYGYALAVDTVRQVAVAFGTGPGGVYQPAETWEFDGNDWRRPLLANAPAARQGHAMVFDASLAACVLFGGDDGSLSPLSDTWLYDDRGWRQRITQQAPFGLVRHAMAYDPWRGRTLLHGGDDRFQSVPSGELWEFDGQDWTPIAVTTASPQRRSHALAFDPARGTLLLCGGSDYVGVAPYPAPPLTFHFEPLPAPTFARYGSGCPGSAGTPSLALAPGSLPQLGTTLVLQVHSVPIGPGASFLALGFGVDRFAGAPLPLDLAGFGMPGCQLWIAVEPGFGLLSFYQGSIAQHAIPLPQQPALAGQRFAVQPLVLDASQAGFATVGNAGLVTVQ